MDYQGIRYDRDGPVTLVTLDRRGRTNAIDHATAEELVDAWSRFRYDDGARVGALTGAGAPLTPGLPPARP